MRFSWIIVALLTSVTFAEAQQAVVALDLGPAATHPPEAPQDWRSGVVLDRFLSASGAMGVGTPTSASVLWDNAALYVRFQCDDPDATYVDGSRPARTDQVEIGFVPPGMGQQDLWYVTVDRDGTVSVLHAGHSSPLRGATVQTHPSSWTAQIAVPWSALGGQPAKPFLLQLSRVRGITGEVMSPSAFDYHDGPVDKTHSFTAPAHSQTAIDEFMEVSLGGQRSVRTASFGLIQLPSGVQHWESRAIAQSVSPQDRRLLADLQRELPSVPTTAANAAARVRLAELWYDLLTQDGFSFLQQQNIDRIDGIVPVTPWMGRQKFNNAMRAGDTAAAYRTLDSVLNYFDRISTAWYVDGTPGDVRESAWKSVVLLGSAPAKDNELIVHARAGVQPIDLFISFPALGGVRIHGATQGFFSPEKLLPMHLVNSPGGVRASSNSLTVDIGFNRASHIAIYRGQEPQPIWALGASQLFLDHNSDGAIQGFKIDGNLRPAEKIMGFGERFDALDQRGRTVTLWQQDAWESTVFGGLSNQAYKNIPLWHSSRGYSIFWNSSYQIQAEFSPTPGTTYQITAHGPVFDLYFWPGGLQNALHSYTVLTGDPLLPPLWAFEPWMGGGSIRWDSEPGKTPEQAVLDVVAHFQRLGIPHSNIYAEGVASTDLDLYGKLKPTGIRVLSWGRSQPLGWGMQQIEQPLPSTPPNQLPLMRLVDGHIYGQTPTGAFLQQFLYIDFTSPLGVDLLRAYWKRWLELGVAGTMVDFGDLVPRNALFYDGSTGEQMHNWYAHSYQLAYNQIFQQQRGDDFILFARGGAPGTQTVAGQMSGDHSSNFRGLQESILGGLTISMSGFSNWGSDVGGLVGKPDLETYIRWIEFGAFSPLMRFHGTEPREPWYYGDAAVAAYTKYAWLRENLLPYIDAAAQEAHNGGMPIMRALPAVASDEYMFGDDLLVAPVHAPGEHRTIALPPGQWTSLWTGATVTSGTHAEFVPLDTIPVYLRSGALLPVEIAPDMVLGEPMPKQKVTALLVTPPGSAGNARRIYLPGSSQPAMFESHAIPGGFEVHVQGQNALQCIEVLGWSAPITSIRVDGHNLPQRQGAPAFNETTSWSRTVDHAIVIPLSSAQDHVVRLSTR